MFCGSSPVVAEVKFLSGTPGYFNAVNYLCHAVWEWNYYYFVSGRRWKINEILSGKNMLNSEQATIPPVTNGNALK